MDIESQVFANDEAKDFVCGACRYGDRVRKILIEGNLPGCGRHHVKMSP